MAGVLIRRRFRHRHIWWGGWLHDHQAETGRMQPESKKHLGIPGTGRDRKGGPLETLEGAQPCRLLGLLASRL